MSYPRAGERIEQLELEVRPLLAQARAEIEARAHARYTVQLAEHEARLAARAAKKERGEKIRGQPPPAPTPEPGARDQYNFTDAESRIMKAGGGHHFEQSYHAQAAVEVESRLIGPAREPGSQRQTGTEADAGERARRSPHGRGLQMFAPRRTDNHHHRLPHPLKPSPTG